MYSAINQLKPVNDTQQHDIWAENRYEWKEKLADFIEDPLAYIATAFLMVSFVVFTVGTYLPDYDGSEYEVVSSARDSIQAFGAFLFPSCSLTFRLPSFLQ